MKPENWTDMSPDDRTKCAISLFSSLRGRLVLGQALAWATATMRTQKYPEVSNIEDMEILGELFQPFFTLYCDNVKKLGGSSE